MQGHDPGRPPDPKNPVHWPSTPLQHALRPCHGSDQVGSARRHHAHPRPVAPQQCPADSGTARARSRPANPSLPGQLAKANPPGGCRIPRQPQSPQLWLPRYQRAGALAALSGNRRRLDGRARQPSARCLQHLPGQDTHQPCSPHRGHGCWRQELLPGRSRGRGSGFLYLRVSRPTLRSSPAGNG